MVGGLPRWLTGKKPNCQCRRHKRYGFNTWVGKIFWMKKWQPTPAFLPGKSHGQRSLVGNNPWVCKIRHGWVTWVCTHAFMLKYSSGRFILLYFFLFIRHKFLESLFEINLYQTTNLVCPLVSRCIPSTNLQFRSVQSLRMSDVLWSNGLQHTRPPCPSPTPGVYSDSCPLSWWCHPDISSSVIPYSSCLQSLPASGSGWRRLLRVPWTARRSNQSILKISPEWSLEGLMLKLQ